MILLYKRYKLCHAVFMEASKVKDIKEKEIGDTMKEPKFSRLKEDIKAKIVHSEWKAGDKIPSENMFAAQYHISRQTVRKAIGTLEEDGLVQRIRGSGTYVSFDRRKNLEQRNRIGNCICRNCISTEG